MSELPNPVIESRNALFDFALAVFEWDRRPSERTCARLIDKARTAGATTGAPESFEEFAHSIEQQQAHGEGETR